MCGRDVVFFCFYKTHATDIPRGCCHHTWAHLLADNFRKVAIYGCATFILPSPHQCERAVLPHSTHLVAASMLFRMGCKSNL
jgi:hypothetical protein